MTALIEATDADFAWMLDDAPGRPDLALPPGGVDDAGTLAFLRGLRGRLNAAGVSGSWMIVADGEVVGLCGYLRPPADGKVEIGYGVAEAHRRRGHATAAVAAMVAAASQKALEANGFAQVGRRTDPDDGEVMAWRLTL